MTWRSVRACLLLAMLLAGLGLPSGASAQQGQGFQRQQVQIILREGLSAILERHLESAAPSDLVLWSLRGLSAVDPGLAVQVQGGTLALSLQGRLLGERPLSGLLPAAAAQALADEQASRAAEMLLRFYIEAWNASATLQRAGANRMLQAGFDEIFNHLDPYSRYIDAEEAEAARQRRVGQSGLGFRLAAGQRGALVIAVLNPGSIAAQGGVREGDVLLAIDGVPVSSRRISQAAELLEGPSGSSVELTLRRGRQQLTLVLQRDSQGGQALRAEWSEGILWLHLRAFSTMTTEWIIEALNSAFSGPTPPRGVVLDLRGNRGGLLGQAMTVSDAFLTQGVIAQSAGRHPEARRVWEAGGHDLARGRPVVVLVDGRTASSAEIVAAALSDRARAVVVGSATLGKGLIQIVYPLANGAEVLVSWSRVLAPLGWPVQGLGIIPAVCTSLGADSLRGALQALSQGTSPMAPVLQRLRQARAPVPASEVAALRAQCPPAEGRPWDQEAARYLIDHPAAYQAAAGP
ncbi:S41 family peptidase [Pseudoroseomonas sp. WGS1072]|uniref:S41 family peptidase n=1 Tax=Roseomonas sp. WGS1072 TaxID=3366816 RepID=UPI003BEF7664